MNKFLTGFILVYFLSACNQTKDTGPSQKLAEARQAYEKNLATLKKGITAFEKENLNEWATTVADTSIWNSAAYGSVPGGKKEWKDLLQGYITDWDSLALIYPDFLPGIDSATHEFDGSVRYYGIWVGVHKSGVRTSVNFYATYDFNSEAKIVNASEFFDVGGLMNAVKGNKKLK